MIRIATGITQDYQSKAAPYIESLCRNANVPFTVFAVDFHAPNMVRVDYSKLPQLPYKMLQAGSFVHCAPDDWENSDVIIFTDADAVLQRPFTQKELNLFENGTVLMGRNKPDPQTLEDEAKALFPTCSDNLIDNRFPGYRSVPCYNTGFVAAPLEMWRQILDEFLKWQEAAQAVFQHYALVQFTLCYAINTLKLPVTELPLSIHAHGHHGLPKGVYPLPDGVWYYDDVPIAFAHAL